MVASPMGGRMALDSVLKQFQYELNTTFFLSLFCFIIALFVFKLIKRRSKTNLPPSPPKLPFIGNLHQLGTLPHRSFRALSQKYGPLMLLQLGQTPTLVVSSADVAREMVKNHDIVFSNRPNATASNILLYGRTDVAFAPYEEEWRQKKKISVSELLSLKRVRSYQFIREEEVAEMVDTIREGCAESRPSVNLSEMLIAASNNIVSRCVLGQKYDTPDSSSSFRDIARKMMVQIAAFSFGNFFPSLGWLDVITGLIPDLKATFREFDAFLDLVIAQHKTNERNDGQFDKKDFVDILLQLQDELTQDSIKAILLDMFLGGSDTTSTTLEWAMAELMRNPNTMRKAQEEVRRMVGYKSKVDENDVRQMKYLECVVKETFRLHPPGPLLGPRETTSNVKLRGYDIPLKTQVFVNAWAIQRDPEYWERPEEFLSGRFENSEVDFKGQDFQFIPFGIGRRGCPGMSFGVASVEHVLANILHWFDWKLPSTQEDIDMSETYGLSVSKKIPLHLQPILHSI